MDSKSQTIDMCQDIAVDNGDELAKMKQAYFSKVKKIFKE